MARIHRLRFIPFAFISLPLLCLSSFLVPHATASDLETKLKAQDIQQLARKARKEGKPRRGALLFYTSAAGCIKCHSPVSGASPLGPNLATIGKSTTDEHIVQSLLHPSKVIRKGYETHVILKNDGRNVSGMVVRENEKSIVLRDLTELREETTIPRPDIDEIKLSPLSVMPEGLTNTLKDEQEFLHLARYVMDIAKGGQEVADQLKPAPDDLRVFDDSQNLDHAGILRSLADEDFEAGKRIYLGHCKNCHGEDGNHPTLATARAFGKQKLKFGADPHKMFLTLTRGGGLMTPMTHLLPKERYQVVHFIREALMKSSNPEYVEIDDAYLDSLPKGTLSGEFASIESRDFGAVLGAQLRREVQNGLHFRLPHDISVCYDLHRGRFANAWKGGFLDLSQTHHYRQRGERMPKEQGHEIPGLAAWQWRLGDSFELSDGCKPKRGPVRKDWWEYHGHYLHGRNAVLSYAVHGRDVLETIAANQSDGVTTLEHTLRIEPGQTSLALATAKFETQPDSRFLFATDTSKRLPSVDGPADQTTVMLDNGDNHVGIAAIGNPRNLEGATWAIDDASRVILSIPADDQPRVIRVVRTHGSGEAAWNAFLNHVEASQSTDVTDPKEWTRGGPARWPEQLKVTGELGESVNGYALDTIPVPFENPWNAWVRTSAVDFFDDGRAAVTTHGGDVYIVSGIDEGLSEVTWKRYVAGLFEPFGVRIVDDVVYVTTRDGVKRLHDVNNNGECDFVEAFWTDTDVSNSFHAFNFDLQTDSQGNFYLAKSGQYTSHGRPGAIMKIPPTGGKAEVLAYGIRTPNGMGKMPGDRFTVSDNQGPWMPASKISLIRRDDFLGNMPINEEQEEFLKARHAGELPETFDEPIIWMPQELDSSSGGQVWNTDTRWGPLAGRMIHSSFGKGWLFYLSLQDVATENEPMTQASIVKLPHQWDAGVMRLRVNPRDGQVYGTGLSGWQGPPHGKDGCFQRLRYTDNPSRIIEKTEVTAKGIRLYFNFALNPKSAGSASAYEAEMWDYLWSKKYGSDQFSVRNPGQEGHDPLTIKSAVISGNNKIVDLTISDLAVCDQVLLEMAFEDAVGRKFEETVHLTVHALPVE